MQIAKSLQNKERKNHLQYYRQRTQNIPSGTAQILSHGGHLQNLRSFSQQFMQMEEKLRSEKRSWQKSNRLPHGTWTHLLDQITTCQRFNPE